MPSCATCAVLGALQCVAVLKLSDECCRPSLQHRGYYGCSMYVSLQELKGLKVSDRNKRIMFCAISPHLWVTSFKSAAA